MKISEILKYVKSLVNFKKEMAEIIKHEKDYITIATPDIVNDFVDLEMTKIINCNYVI